jgi:NADH:ubiquinone oxidoreductase subunit B-like Fe-S oxidoreductase
MATASKSYQSHNTITAKWPVYNRQKIQNFVMMHGNINIKFQNMLSHEWNLMPGPKFSVQSRVRELDGTVTAPCSEVHSVHVCGSTDGRVQLKCDGTR